MRPDVLRQTRFRHHHVPIQQQVVVIEQAAFLLALDVPAIQLAQLGFPAGAPWILLLQGVFQGLLRVDAIRVDLQAGFLFGETLILRGEPLFLADRVDQVGAVAAIEHGELRIQLQMPRIVAQQPIADRMECSGPSQPLLDRLGSSTQDVVQRLFGYLLGTAAHFGGGAASERQHQDAAGVDAIQSKVRHPVRERVGLAGTRTGNDEQRPRLHALVLRQQLAVAHRLALWAIQLLEM